MSRNVVVDESRGIRICGDDFTVSGQSGFDQCLEAVANSKDQAIAVFEKIGNRIGNAWVAKNRGDEFCGAIGFVACGESPRNEEDL